jgi:hypothetical protein
MSKIMLGDLQSPQEGLLNGREGLRQVTLLAHAEDDYTLELPGHHVGGGTAGGLIVPTRERRVARFQAQTHGVLDKTPDQPRNQQHQTQRLDAVAVASGTAH